MESQSIRDTARTLGVNISKLNAVDGMRFRQAVADRYAGGRTRWLWEGYAEPSCAVRDPQAWRWLDEFLGHEEVVLFFNAGDDDAVFIFSDGADVVPVLGESPPFEFYLTNGAMEYVIGENHHGVLSVLGTAREWLLRRCGQSP